MTDQLHIITGQRLEEERARTQAITKRSIVFAECFLLSAISMLGGFILGAAFNGGMF